MSKLPLFERAAETYKETAGRLREMRIKRLARAIGSIPAATRIHPSLRENRAEIKTFTTGSDLTLYRSFMADPRRSDHEIGWGETHVELAYGEAYGLQGWFQLNAQHRYIEDDVFYPVRKFEYNSSSPETSQSDFSISELWGVIRTIRSMPELTPNSVQALPPAELLVPIQPDEQL
jgi:hypothetical protein